MIQLRAKKNTQPKKTATPSQPSPAPVAQQQTFMEHLYELRSRLFWITASLIVASAVGFQYKDVLVSFIMAPLHGQKLVYLTPGGGFSFIFTICLYFGALVTIPVVVYHIYRFLQPVLGRTSRKFVVLILLLSSALAASGALFGYFVAVPAAIQFLMTFAGDAVTPNLTAESYLGFIVAYMLGLAALFQLPLLLYITDHVKPFPPGTLLSSQRFVIVGAVIAAAIITPTPDIVNQLIVAGPIILIYQLGAIAVYFRHKAVARRQRIATKKLQSAQKQESPHLTEQVARDTPSITVPAVATSTASPGPADIQQSQAPVRKRVAKAAASGVQQKQHRRMDGFVAKPRASTNAVVVPSRVVTQTVAAAAVPARRSVDGFAPRRQKTLP